MRIARQRRSLRLLILIAATSTSLAWAATPAAHSASPSIAPSDPRVPPKTGIDTLIKSPDGSIITLDVGQKTTILGDDFDFKGRWDIALGNPDVEFGKICGALGQ